MKNIVTLSIQFYFKGEEHKPSVTLELDELILSINDLSHFYPLLAKENNYDMYSYEFEMMQAEQITFSEAQGMVSNHIEDGSLNLETFKAALNNQNTLAQLQTIAKNILQIDELGQHPELEKALFKAYTLGKDSAPNIAHQNIESF